jgi:hypothetical protein
VFCCLITSLTRKSLQTSRWLFLNLIPSRQIDVLKTERFHRCPQDHDDRRLPCYGKTPALEGVKAGEETDRFDSHAGRAALVAARVWVDRDRTPHVDDLEGFYHGPALSVEMQDALRSYFGARRTAMDTLTRPVPAGPARWGMALPSSKESDPTTGAIP